MNKKDSKIIADCERDSIPMFAFTAKDVLSAEAMRQYLAACIKGGCNREHVAEVYDRILEFEEWQNNNPEKVKYPD